MAYRLRYQPDMPRLSRRSLLLAGIGTVCAGTPLWTHADPIPANKGVAAPSPSSPPAFDFSLNTGTISGFNLGIEEEINVAAKAGYHYIEPWIRSLEAFVEKGGNLADLKKRLDDHGIGVVNAIAFFPWVVDDATRRAAGIEQMKREMAILQALDCPRIAATGSGTGENRMNDFSVMGERYRAILEIGESMGVIPQLEIWGAAKTLNTLSDAMAVAAAAGHAKSSLLLDAYHLYRGGSSFEGLRLVDGKALGVFHINDYPADPPREKARDRDRVYPGDGVCPLPLILDILKSNGFAGVLSFEVFNPNYWATGDPVGVARTGLEKMKALCAGK
ncbi:MAG TPA: xylose isomerase [Planctomycetaceae bacterium]|nr:xylose isomerase [Planctomycetaceae bacterium]